MKYTSKLSNKINNKLHQIIYLFFCYISIIFLLASAKVSADAIVMQLEGSAKIKVDGLHKRLLLTEGSWVRSKDKLFLSNSDQVTVLCLQTGKIIKLEKTSQLDKLCNSKNRKMRSSSETEVPVLLIPNQKKLSSLKKVVWTGPRKTLYGLSVIKYDADGDEVESNSFKNWKKLDSFYIGNGIHEFNLEKALSFSIKEDEYYEIIITNKDSSLSSKAVQIEYPEPKRLIDKITESVTKAHVKDTSLRKLIIAAQLAARKCRAQAYEILQQVETKEWSALKQLIKAKIFRIPDAPAIIMVAEYGKALEIAIKKKSKVNAAIACKEFLTYAQLLPNKNERIYERVIKLPDYSEYCLLEK